MPVPGPGPKASPKFWPCDRQSWVDLVWKERKILDNTPGAKSKPRPFPNMRDNITLCDDRDLSMRRHYLGTDMQPDLRIKTTYRDFCAEWDQDEVWDDFNVYRKYARSRASSVPSSRTALITNAQANRIRDAARSALNSTASSLTALHAR